MPPLPHQFAGLRQGQRPPFLIAGAGLSHSLVPLPRNLLLSRKDAAEAELGCTSVDIDPNHPYALYDWAKQIIDQLRAKHVPIPKLRLADALLLTVAGEWSGKVGLPLRGTMPRHRVIARLAREDRWASLWTFNWDAHIENALEKIGFDRDEPSATQPWRMAYRTILTAADFTHLTRRDLLCILKPHGCVRGLIAAKELEATGNLASAEALADRFMITKDDLDAERTNPTDQRFFIKLKSSLIESPLIVAGWSISEPYLIAVINETLKPFVRQNELEELTILDITFNPNGHAQTAECYGLAQPQVFMQLETTANGFNCDSFFLWVQAVFALDRILNAAPVNTTAAIGTLRSGLIATQTGHCLIEFADDFLPAWVRFCWRSGLITCPGFQSHELRMELEDLHIPLQLPNVVRRDLAAAAYLLTLIPPNCADWDFSQFPGSLWNRVTGHLVIPIPSWSSLVEIAALQPLMASLEKYAGFITAISLLPLTFDQDNAPILNDVIEAQKPVLASFIPITKYADPSNLNIINNLAA